MCAMGRFSDECLQRDRTSVALSLHPLFSAKAISTSRFGFLQQLVITFVFLGINVAAFVPNSGSAPPISTSVQSARVLRKRISTLPITGTHYPPSRDHNYVSQLLRASPSSLQLSFDISTIPIAAVEAESSGNGMGMTIVLTAVALAASFLVDVDTDEDLSTSDMHPSEQTNQNANRSGDINATANATTNTRTAEKNVNVQKKRLSEGMQMLELAAAAKAQDEARGKYNVAAAIADKDSAIEQQARDILKVEFGEAEELAGQEKKEAAEKKRQRDLKEGRLLLELAAQARQDDTNRLTELLGPGGRSKQLAQVRDTQYLQKDERSNGQLHEELGSIEESLAELQKAVKMDVSAEKGVDGTAATAVPRERQTKEKKVDTAPRKKRYAFAAFAYLFGKQLFRTLVV